LRLELSKLKQFLIPIIALAAALCVVCFPLQLYFPLARVQHYGLALFVWGLGFIVQWVWYYRTNGKWSRWSYLTGGLYLTSLGMTFYSHPWLDPKFAVQTAEQENYRVLIGFLYTGLAFPISFIWARGFQEETAPRAGLSAAGMSKQKPKKNKKNK
jgi:hypothetical protein